MRQTCIPLIWQAKHANAVLNIFNYHLNVWPTTQHSASTKQGHSMSTWRHTARPLSATPTTYADKQRPTVSNSEISYTPSVAHGHIQTLG